MGVVEPEQRGDDLARTAEVAAELRDEEGADVRVMGRAGMARYRDRLQRHVGRPVVEPQPGGGVSTAIGVAVGWSA